MKKRLLFSTAIVLIFTFSSCDILKEVATKTIEGQVACVPATTGKYTKSYELVKAKKFEDDRKSTATRETKHLNCMTTAQIKKITQLFKFEDSRLDYAKLAYYHCSDPDNFLSITEVFKFESSKRELEEFVR